MKQLLKNVLALPKKVLVKLKQRMTAPVSSTGLALVVALAIPAFYNVTLWVNAWNAMAVFSIKALGFCFALYALMALLLLILCVLLSHRWVFKPLLIILIMSSAAVAYFNSIGVVIDEAMLKNIIETDVREATELFTTSLLFYLVVFGLLPSLLIARLTVRYQKLLPTLGFGGLYIGVLGVTFAGLLLSNFQYITFFGRENRDLRFYINPIFPIISLRKYVLNTYKTHQKFVVIGLDSAQNKQATLASGRGVTDKPATNSKRTIGIMMVGETARADHFAVNGYGKNTTPNLLRLNTEGELFNFTNATSCGTSTAYSVPCMFSFLGAEDYSPDAAGLQSNVLDVLERAGVKTLWRDNNSSCKGVCERIETQNFHETIDEHSVYFHDGEYIDEILLTDLDKVIASTDKDILIVMHQLGSHGPAYHHRYPESFAQFSPNCASNAPQNCTPEEVSNSYDNTIYYTDYVLNKAIEWLRKKGEDNKTFMLYASDHGESLGEDGVYLHGLPKAIAPKAQTHVPMVMWMSPSMREAQGLEAGVNEQCLTRAVSHDYVSHTLLSLYQVATTVKKPSYNLLDEACGL